MIGFGLDGQTLNQAELKQVIILYTRARTRTHARTQGGRRAHARTHARVHSPSSADFMLTRPEPQSSDPLRLPKAGRVRLALESGRVHEGAGIHPVDSTRERANFPMQRRSKGEEKERKENVKRVQL